MRCAVCPFFRVLACAGVSFAADISGTISSTLTITEDSKLVGDVTCTVTGVPCIILGASNISLDLNGFTMTGLANPDTGCQGAPTALVPGSTEDGVFANMQRGIAIRGPGIIQRFRGVGIFTFASNAVAVSSVTAAAGSVGTGQVETGTRPSSAILE